MWHLNQSFLKGPFNYAINEFPADHTSQNDSSSAISNVPSAMCSIPFHKALPLRNEKETHCKGVMHCPTSWWKTPVFVKARNVPKAAANGLFV